jgi:hypothetical protein
MFAVRAYSSGRITKEKRPVNPVLASDANPECAVVKAGESSAQLVELWITPEGEEGVDFTIRDHVDRLIPIGEFKIKIIARIQSLNQEPHD